MPWRKGDECLLCGEPSRPSGTRQCEQGLEGSWLTRAGQDQCCSSTRQLGAGCGQVDFIEVARGCGTGARLRGDGCTGKKGQRETCGGLPDEVGQSADRFEHCARVCTCSTCWCGGVDKDSEGLGRRERGGPSETSSTRVEVARRHETRGELRSPAGPQVEATFDWLSARVSRNDQKTEGARPQHGMHGDEITPHGLRTASFSRVVFPRRFPASFSHAFSCDGVGTGNRGDRPLRARRSR